MRTLMLIFFSFHALNVWAQTPVAQGVFRLPFENGTDIFVSNSHDVHNNRLDLSAVGSNTVNLVAAARGTVRIVVDDNNTFCPREPASLIAQFDTNGNGSLSNAEYQATLTSATNTQVVLDTAASVCASYSGPSMCCMRGMEPEYSCTASGFPAATCSSGADGNGPNNYIWIEHENKEWSKYSHVQFNTAQVSVNEVVDAGQILGVEGDVGFATGPHVHFEIAALDSVNDIGATGFAVDDDTISGINIRHRVPFFCQEGLLIDNETVTAVQCDDLCGQAFGVVNGTVGGNSPALTQVSNELQVSASIEPGSGLSARAAQTIHINPGFHAEGGSFFAATIGDCDSPGGVGE